MTVRRHAISVLRAAREAERYELEMTSCSVVVFLYTAAFASLSRATTIVLPISISAAWFAMPF